jgi:hypothetical protein
MHSIVFLFIHGYSVSDFETYGELPHRLKEEAILRGYDVKLQDIFLARYVTFNDEVRMDDLSLALEHAIKEYSHSSDSRFVCVTHSTGGPVVRNWWNIYYRQKNIECPMSHLIMLAPPNHGSALAQLGKSRISRIKSWVNGVEPGQNILDWLELGSDASCTLNKDWITSGMDEISSKGVFLFVITGQDIDRKLYDHINSYTGEPGSDGVVRVCSANLNSSYIRLVQKPRDEINGKLDAGTLEVAEHLESPLTPFRIVKARSHSNSSMGIMKSVRRDPEDSRNEETINAIFSCIEVKSRADYRKLYETFLAETKQIQDSSRIEVYAHSNHEQVYIHDRYSMIIFRISDSSGALLHNFDLLLTAGDNDPDSLPPGFFGDRQCNLVNRSVITYYLNYDILNGTDELKAPGGKIIRPAIKGIRKLGLILRPRPEEGFIHYLPCKLDVSEDFFKKALKANSTTIIDICLQRVVTTELFRFEKTGEEMIVKDFRKISPGNDIPS